MTIEEAKEYIPNFEAFRNEACATCTEEWYCSRKKRRDYRQCLRQKGGLQ